MNDPPWNSWGCNFPSLAFTANAYSRKAKFYTLSTVFELIQHIWQMQSIYCKMWLVQYWIKNFTSGLMADIFYSNTVFNVAASSKCQFKAYARSAIKLLSFYDQSNMHNSPIFWQECNNVPWQFEDVAAVITVACKYPKSNKP